jgi:hypothetical protein
MHFDGAEIGYPEQGFGVVAYKVFNGLFPVFGVNLGNPYVVRF